MKRENMFYGKLKKVENQIRGMSLFRVFIFEKRPYSLSRAVELLEGKKAEYDRRVDRETELDIVDKGLPKLKDDITDLEMKISVIRKICERQV